MVTSPAAIPEYEVTQDERTFATLAHALQLVGWWIAPLVLLFVKRESRFVKFHALQALLWQICLAILSVVIMTAWLAAFVGVMFAHGTPPPNAPPPAGFFIIMPLVWLSFMTLMAGTVVLAIVYAIKAGRGEWANYPVLGRLARKFLKF